MWDFGDGNSSTTADPEHTYSTVGNFLVRLVVADNRGSTGEATQFVRVVYRSYWVNFTLGSGNLDNQRDFTGEGLVTTLNLTMDQPNLHMVRFRLSWRDNIKPPGGDPNDVFRLTVTPPKGNSMTANGSTENLTVLFPLASIPLNRTMEGTSQGEVGQKAQEQLGSTLGVGIWLVQVEAVECGGFRDAEDNFIADPGNLWDLAIHYEFYQVTVIATG
jgi:hypothetical protein